MRWKLLRRRLSISAPRMIVRSHLPWPVRWVVLALVFGFSAALAMWAFEFGREIAGLEPSARKELIQLRAEVKLLRDEREHMRSISDTADSLLKTELATQDKLNQQLRQVEAENLALKADLGFFERLMPASGDGLAIRSVQAETVLPGQLRYQMLVMQSGKAPAEFKGRYQLQLTGTLDGKLWTLKPPAGPQPISLRQYVRVDGLIDYPVPAVVKTVQIRVMDSNGGLRATQIVKL